MTERKIMPKIDDEIEFCYSCRSKSADSGRKQKCNSIMRGYRPDLLTYIQLSITAVGAEAATKLASTTGKVISGGDGFLPSLV